MDGWTNKLDANSVRAWEIHDSLSTKKTVRFARICPIFCRHLCCCSSSKQTTIQLDSVKPEMLALNWKLINLLTNLWDSFWILIEFIIIRLWCVWRMVLCQQNPDSLSARWWWLIFVSRKAYIGIHTRAQILRGRESPTKGKKIFGKKGRMKTVKNIKFLSSLFARFLFFWGPTWAREEGMKISGLHRRRKNGYILASFLNGEHTGIIIH